MQSFFYCILLNRVPKIMSSKVFEPTELFKYLKKHKGSNKRNPIVDENNVLFKYADAQIDEKIFEFRKQDIIPYYLTVKNKKYNIINALTGLPHFFPNVPYEINLKDRGGRIFIVSEIWNVMKEVGYKWFGLIDLEEDSPHRSKTTAWGSWMNCSQPYIYNPKECIIIAYKNSPKKLTKGEPQWKGTPTEIEQEDGTFKKKVVYDENDKKEFMELVFGQWNYFADTKSLTKATFSMDIPTKAIKILSYKNDIVLDPFAGSGTSLVAAEVLGRRWLGIELSPNYTEIARTRVEYFKKLEEIKEDQQ